MRRCSRIVILATLGPLLSGAAFEEVDRAKEKEELILKLTSDINKVDYSIEETKELVEKWFGEIRRGPDVEPISPMPVTLGETRSVYHADNFAKLPELRMVYPTVEQYHDDSYALNALGRILADGKRAPLYNVIVEEQQLAPDVGAYHSTDELAGSFNFRVRAKAGVDLDDVKAAIDTALARFEEKGFLDKDLRFRSRYQDRGTHLETNRPEFLVSSYVLKWLPCRSSLDQTSEPVQLTLGKSHIVIEIEPDSVKSQYMAEEDLTFQPRVRNAPFPQIILGPLKNLQYRPSFFGHPQFPICFLNTSA